MEKYVNRKEKDFSLELSFFKSRRFIILAAAAGIVVSFAGYLMIKSRMEQEVHVMDISAQKAQAGEPGAENHGESGDEEEDIWIHVTGCVNNPGPVKISAGQRIKDAIEAAGGLLPEADSDAINMVYELKDGQKVYVPPKTEKGTGQARTYAAAGGQAAKPAGAQPSGNPGVIEDGTGVVEETAESTVKSGKININTASEAELDKLPGVGPSTAAKIIEYRNKYGKFKKVQDIMNVYGIGQSKFDKMKDMIAVD